MNKGINKIPYGYYCYTFRKEIRNDNGELIGFDINRCPYWKVKKLKNSEIEYYHCKYLNENDMGNLSDEEYHKILNYFGNDENKVNDFFKLWLLWDQVKECGINEDEDEDEK